MSSSSALASPGARYRSSGTLQSAVSSVNTTNGAPGGPLLIPYSVGNFRQMTDFVTPGFHRRKNLGQVFFSPMESTDDTYKSSSGNGQILTHISSNTAYGLEGPDSFVYYLGARLKGLNNGPIVAENLISSTEWVDLGLELSTAVRAERGRSDSNLWESVAEANQTLEMLAKPFSAFSAFQRKFRLSASALTASALWLQYRYGLLPFIGDVESILNAHSKRTGRIRKTTRRSDSISRQSSGSHDLVESIMRYQIRTQTTDSVIVRAMSLDEYDATLGNNLGFTAKGLIGLPWELVPFSFVADWFANIGDYLNAFIPTVGYTQLGSCLTYDRTKTTVYHAGTCSIEPSYAANWRVTRPVTGSYTATNKGKSRLPLAEASLTLKSDFRFDSNIRLADALSLLYQEMERQFSKAKGSRS